MVNFCTNFNEFRQTLKMLQSFMRTKACVKGYGKMLVFKNIHTQAEVITRKIDCATMEQCDSRVELN